MVVLLAGPGQSGAEHHDARDQTERQLHHEPVPGRRDGPRRRRAFRRDHDVVHDRDAALPSAQGAGAT